jgi:radical SAM enzyme (TIGR01210 family)
MQIYRENSYHMVSTTNLLAEKIHQLYRTYGPSKQMGDSAPAPNRPHFFLHRNFLGEQDLAILFNTKRCQYQCKFCALPNKSSYDWIEAESILTQFEYVITEMKHSLGLLDRLTIANEGSVFDERTFPTPALFEIIDAAARLPRLAKFVIETRLEFLDIKRLQHIRTLSGKRVDILTGFETLDEHIREDILGKREPLEAFQSGLDRLAACEGELTTYVLFKPSPYMTDAEAIVEAERSIDYIPFTIRLNPMYVAESTPWARLAKSLENYKPPRLTDVIALADKKKSEGIKVYLGLTSEGLSAPENTYRGREDFSSQILKQAIIANTP